MKKYNRLKANTPAHNWWKSFDTEQQCLIWDKIFNIRQKYDYTDEARWLKSRPKFIRNNLATYR